MLTRSAAADKQTHANQEGRPPNRMVPSPPACRLRPSLKG